MKLEKLFERRREVKELARRLAKISKETEAPTSVFDLFAYYYSTELGVTIMEFVGILESAKMRIYVENYLRFREDAMRVIRGS